MTDCRMSPPFFYKFITTILLARVLAIWLQKAF